MNMRTAKHRKPWQLFTVEGRGIKPHGTHRIATQAPFPMLAVIGSYSVAPTLTRSQWQRRYARQMQRRADLPRLFAMQCAQTAWESDDNRNYCPIEMADEELSCWTH